MIDSDSDNDDPARFWDFRAVRRFRRAFNPPPDLDNDPQSSVPDVANFVPKAIAPKSLGDFERLLGFCGKPIHIPNTISNDCRDVADSSSQQSDRSTPPTSTHEDDTVAAEHFDEFVARAGKTVQWEDEVGDEDLAEFRRKSAQDAAAHLDPATVERLLEISSDVPSEAETPTTPTPKSSRTLKKRTRNILDGVLDTVSPLIPHSVILPKKSIDRKQHPPPDGLLPILDPSEIYPIYTLTNNEQKAKLIKKMSKQLGNMAQENYGQAVQRLGGLPEVNGIHVFVDMSNIHIGYQDQIKLNRGIPAIRHVRNLPLSFSSLALIMERGRKVTRRVVAGSSVSTHGETVKLHKHFSDAKTYGYEVNILERVLKPSTSSNKKKKKHGTGSGYATSGNSSASESGMAVRQLKMQEQAVDELLQMKMLESIVDTQTPSTIVLASGDAAEAEFSGGFLKNVERALSKGWKVEVVAWKKGLSFEYRSQKLLKKWGTQLRIIELDQFCEEMLAVYVPTFTQNLITQSNGMPLVEVRRKDCKEW